MSAWQDYQNSVNLAIAHSGCNLNVIFKTKSIQ